MSTRVDSYNADDATDGVSIQSRLGHTSRVHRVAGGTQFDLTGSDAGNSEFFFTGTANAATIFTFADGSSIQANQLITNTKYEYTLSKVVTHADNPTVIFWK